MKLPVRYSIFLAFVFLCVVSVCADAVQDQFGRVPKEWHTKTDSKYGFKLDRLMDGKGNCIAIYIKRNGWKQSFRFFRNRKHLRHIGNAKLTRFTRYAYAPHAKTFMFRTYGLSQHYHKSGTVRGLVCINHPGKDSLIGKNESIFCDYSKQFKPDGSLKKITRYKAKCRLGCGQFRPLLPRGKYTVTASELNVRSKPSVKSKALFGMKKGTEVMVIKDTHKIETISYERAPWVKIRLADGRSGYAFGGFLKMNKSMPQYVRELCEKGFPE